MWTYSWCVAVGLLFVLENGEGFVAVPWIRRTTNPSILGMAAAPAEKEDAVTSSSFFSNKTKKSTLTDETIWNIRMVLRGVTTAKGKKMDEIFNLQCQFLEEEGYEPPQGKLKLVGSSSSRFQLVKSRWQLSEDPNDRKDGLWVWGLFKEPLYPFLLLQLETAAIRIPNSSPRSTTEEANDENKSNNDGNDKIYEEEDVIQPLQLYAQLNHKRDAEKGVVLTACSDLKIRQMETLNADMFGVSQVDWYEEVNIGTLSIQPSVER